MNYHELPGLTSTASTVPLYMERPQEATGKTSWFYFCKLCMSYINIENIVYPISANGLAYGEIYWKHLETTDFPMKYGGFL